MADKPDEPELAKMARLLEEALRRPKPVPPSQPPAAKDSETVLSNADLSHSGYRAARDDLRQDIAAAVEQSERPSGTAAVSDRPTPDTPTNNKVVFGFCELWALAFGFPPAEDLYHGAPVTPRMVAFTAIGAGFAILGPTWPLIKARFPRRWAASFVKAASDFRYWLAALVLLFLVVQGPDLYRRATEPAQTKAPAGAVKQESPARVSSPARPTVLCWDGPCPPVRVKPGPQYLKDIGLGTGGPTPLTLQATFAATTDRLRVFVDYSEYRNGWMPKTRAFIGEFKEPVKDSIERLQLIQVATKENGGTNKLWWGDPNQNYPVTASTFISSPIPAIIVRARLAIVGPKGEQHYYFILLRAATENAGTQVGIIPEYASGDWIESWENE